MPFRPRGTVRNNIFAAPAVPRSGCHRWRQIGRRDATPGPPTAIWIDCRTGGAWNITGGTSPLR